MVRYDRAIVVIISMGDMNEDRFLRNYEVYVRPPRRRVFDRLLPNPVWLSKLSLLQVLPLPPSGSDRR